MSAISAMSGIDVNCDIGEELDDELDAALFPLITSASIACGGHAGTPDSMTRAVRRALAHQVSVGAHVSYADRLGFGRVSIDLGSTGLAILVRDQVSALRQIAAREGGRLAYVKPHGALYHDANTSLSIADVIVAEALAIDEEVRFVGMTGGAMQAAAGVRFVAEGFPERGYASPTSLQSRALDGALVEDPQLVAQRAVAMASGAPFQLVTGEAVTCDVATICIHSDHPNALANATAVRAALADAGIDVHAFA